MDRPDVRPEIRDLLDTLAALGLPDFSTLEVDEARAQLAGLRAEPDSAGSIHRVEDRTMDGPGGPIGLRIFRPNDDPDLPCLVWLHGGGWVLGDLGATEIPGRALAASAECVVVAVEYRLAPEHPFPAGFEDSLAACRWVVEEANELGIDPARVAVGGDSAGGNLAAAVAAASIQEGPSLIHQVLVYPVTDHDLTRASYIENGEGYFLSRAAMRWFWDHYAGHEQRRDWRASPLHADLEGAPSAWIYTAGFDPLRDEGMELADRLVDAGVAVERMHVPDAIHGVFGMTLGIGDEAREAAAQSLRRAFAR